MLYPGRWIPQVFFTMFACIVNAIEDQLPTNTCLGMCETIPPAAPDLGIYIYIFFFCFIIYIYLLDVLLRFSSKPLLI